MLPWLIPDPQRPDSSLYDCDNCRYGNPKIHLPPTDIKIRQNLHCGYTDEIPESTWTNDPNLPGVPTTIGAKDGWEGTVWREVDPETGEGFPNVCPGWAVRQPLIVEASQAYAAFEKGALESAFPYASNGLIEAILELKRAFDEYSRQQMEAIKQQQERIE